MKKWPEKDHRNQLPGSQVKKEFQKEKWSNYIKCNWQIKLDDDWKLSIGFSITDIIDNFDKSISSKVAWMKACVPHRMKGRELECVNIKNQ